MLLHRPYYEHEGILEVLVEKQRNRPTVNATLTFIKKFMSFQDYAAVQAFQ